MDKDELLEWLIDLRKEATTRKKAEDERASAYTIYYEGQEDLLERMMKEIAK